MEYFVKWILEAVLTRRDKMIELEKMNIQEFEEYIDLWREYIWIIRGSLV